MAQHNPGLTSIFAGWNNYRGYLFHRIILLTFGISLALTGIFSHAPLDTDIPFNQREDQLHSFFASTTGTCFTILAVATSFIQKKSIHKTLSLAIGIMAVVLSVLMFRIYPWRGIWQRLIFIMSFAWMLFIFSRKNSTG